MFSLIQIYGAEKGLENTNNAVFGYLNDTYITLTLQNNIITLIIPATGISKQSIRKLKKEWKKSMPEITLLNTIQQKNYFQTAITGSPKNMDTGVIDFLIDIVLKTIKESGGSLNTHCISCQKETSDYAYNGDYIIPYCDNCQKNILYQIEHNDIPMYAYLTGTIGACFGAIVGFIPYCLVAYFTGNIFGILAFIGASGSLYGYKLCRGAKILWFATVIITAATIMIAFLLQPILAQYISNDPFFLQRFKLLDLFNISSLLMTLLFTLLGIYFSFPSIKKYTTPFAPIPIKKLKL